MTHEKDVLDRRLVMPLARPELADEMGVVPPRAVVLFGPPGTGKTTFAKAIASRLEWPFVEIFPSRLATDAAGLAAALRHTFQAVSELEHAVVFIDGIRVGDIVVVEGAQGRIEEITLTYIVVEVWDGTRLILPCTYFTTTPFENRSHAGASVIGQVQLRVDWTIPVEQVRTELARVLAASPRWDRRHSQLSVEDASGDAVQLIAQFSATADEIELLRFDVREALVRFVRDHHPSSLPRYRRQVVTADGRQPAATAGVGGSS
jgi:DNA polymerase III delta prime subunit